MNFGNKGKIFFTLLMMLFSINLGIKQTFASNMALSPSGKLLLITSANYKINAVDLINGALSTPINLSENAYPHDMAFISDTQALLLFPTKQSLFLIDTLTGNRIKTLTLPAQGAHQLILDAEKRFAFVANKDSGMIYKIDLKTFSIIKEIKIGNEVKELLLSPAQNLLMVADQKDNYLALVDTKNLTLLKKIQLPGVTDQANKLNVTLFQSGPIMINAKPHDVWQIVKAVQNYNKWSNGAITVQMDGPLALGKTIKLSLYKDQCVGKFIPESVETINVIDDNQYRLGWVSQLPIGGKTERYQLLEKMAENQTRSTIVLRIPGIIGSTTKVILGNVIESALNELNEGIKKEAEKVNV